MCDLPWSHLYTGEANVLADALSRLTKHLRVEGRELENVKPRILGLSSCRARRAKQLMQTDPLVANLAQIGSLCPEYVSMLTLVENRTPLREIPPDSELKMIEGSLQEFRVLQLSTGDIVFGLYWTFVSTKMLIFIKNESNMRIFICIFTENKFQLSPCTSDQSALTELGTINLHHYHQHKLKIKENK